MSVVAIPPSPREAARRRDAVATIDEALSAEGLLGAIATGLPAVVVEGIQRSLEAQRSEAIRALEAFDAARAGDTERLNSLVSDPTTPSSPGVVLTVARLRAGYTQKELARRLGLKEQAIQRYEREHYRSVQLQTFLRIAAVLGVSSQFQLNVPRSGWALANDMTSAEARKILRHARSHDWLEDEDQNDETALDRLKRAIGDDVVNYGAPSLLRTGLNVRTHTGDWLLLAWRARVSERARERAAMLGASFSILELD